MPKPDLAPFAARVVAAVKSYVAKAEEGLTARLDALEARLAAMPTPEKGDKGDPGPAGKDADTEAIVRMAVAAMPQPKDGAPGRDGQPGAPGPAGRDGENGKDGRDGFGLEDFSIEMVGRTLTMSFTRGDVKIERAVRVDTVLDCGVYKPETKYEKGDGVTFGGHYWIAKKDEPEFKPRDPADNAGGEPSCWRMAVRRGRDGKDKK